jgi:hypothetical protein
MAGLFCDLPPCSTEMPSTQLKGLKNQMESEKERAEGVLRGTSRATGSRASTTAARCSYHRTKCSRPSPATACLTLRPGKDKRPVAEIERLVDSPLGEFTGRCVRKGKALFVQPDLPGVNRWLFLPPQARKGIGDGDYLRCASAAPPDSRRAAAGQGLERIGGSPTMPASRTLHDGQARPRSGWPERRPPAAEAAERRADPLAEDSSGRTSAISPSSPSTRRARRTSTMRCTPR